MFIEESEVETVGASMRFCGIVWMAVILVIKPGYCQSSTQQMSASAAARFLDQATWGPTPASTAELQQMGIDNWLKVQFALNSSNIPDQPILDSTGQPNRNIHPVQAAFFQNTVTGPDQLRQRVAFALSQIWVVSFTGVPVAYAFPPYWRIFRDNAFGNYRDLIRAVTLSPAMGRYLNVANNNKANPAKNTAANENYARELMQLFTLGLYQLNPDGTPVLDQNHKPLPNYDQTEVTNMAKVVTGWTYPTAPGAKPRIDNPAYYFGPMFAVESEHDTNGKTIFGNITVPAGQTAEQDLESLLDALMAQPTMAPFVSQQLIQHLVTSNPSPQYLARVASVFENDGNGVTGNLQAVVTAILTDPEARAGDDPTATATTSANFGHMREPVVFMSNLLRGLNATLSANSAIYNNSSELGEQLFNAPSVFSYFSPQYRTAGGLLGPEFQIYTTQTAADRADIVSAILYGTIDKGTTVDLTPFLQQVGSTTSLLSYISSVFLHGSMSPALQQAATDAVNAEFNAMAKTQAALYVVLTSGEYQIIH
jgi:uncharacterized protein (DUF1800 family)